MPCRPQPNDLRPGAGVGLKPQHYHAILDAPADAPAWFEVHPQNYMTAGGPPHRYLAAMRAMRPLSFHSVGLSLGSADGPDADQLERLAALVDRYEPALVSDHLSWSRAGDARVPDLLPLPMTTESLDAMAAAVSRVQDRLKRQILVENPSLYLPMSGGQMPEPAFMAELCRRTGCGWLLDLNNVAVAANNLRYNAADYVAAVDPALVGEIHLAGHAAEQHACGQLLIDDHGAPVPDAVWTLYRTFVACHGPRPTLIEWDSNVPPLPDLLAEAGKADRIAHDAGGLCDAA